MPYGHSSNRSHGRRRPGRIWVEDNSFWGRMERHVTEDVYAYPTRSDAVEILFFNLLLELTVELVSVAFGVLGHLALFLLRTGMRLRGRAAAIEATCRQRLRAKRTECVRGEPTPGQLLAAWEESRTSLAGKLRLGALLSEIEPHVDQSLIRDEGGHVVGRRPGIRGWLRERCPQLVPHYKAIMAYKALADKVQMAVGLQSKYSIVDVIDVIIEFGEIDAASRGRGRVARGDSRAGKQTEAARAVKQRVDAERAAGAPEIDDSKERTDWERAADSEKEADLAAPRKTLGELLRSLRDAAERETLESERQRVALRMKAAEMGSLKNERRRVALRAKATPRVKLESERQMVRQKVALRTNVAPRVTLRALDDEVRFRLGLVRMRRFG